MDRTAMRMPLDDFAVNIEFTVMQPNEDVDTKIKRLKELKELNVISRRGIIEELKPDLSPEQITEKLNEIDNEVPFREVDDAPDEI